MDLKIILDLLKEVREDQKEHSKELYKQSAYLQSMDSDVKELKITVSKNTEDIAHHIRRTDLLQELHSENQERIEKSEARLEKLEEPVKAKEWIKNHAVAIITAAAAIASIIALILEHK